MRRRWIVPLNVRVELEILELLQRIVEKERETNPKASQPAVLSRLIRQEAERQSVSN